jgi:hypothetical protein
MPDIRSAREVFWRKKEERREKLGKKVVNGKVVKKYNTFL